MVSDHNYACRAVYNSRGLDHVQFSRSRTGSSRRFGIFTEVNQHSAEARKELLFVFNLYGIINRLKSYYFLKKYD